MLVNLSSVAYTAICALVQDALEVDSDASVLLRCAAQELSGARSDLVAVPSSSLPSERFVQVD